MDKQAEVFSVISNYFSDIFASKIPSSDMMALMIDSVQTKLSEAFCAFVEEPSTVEELKEAVLQREPLKVRILMGFTVCFIPKCARSLIIGLSIFAT